MAVVILIVCSIIFTLKCLCFMVQYIQVWIESSVWIQAKSFYIAISINISAYRMLMPLKCLISREKDLAHY